MIAAATPEPAPIEVAPPKILSPANETTTRDPEASLPVSVEAVFPEGHKLQYFFDGAPLGEPTGSPSATIPPMDRGEHVIEVAIVDSKGKEVSRSTPVTVFHLPVSVLNRN